MYTAGHVSNTNSIMSSKKQFILFFLATPGYSVVQVFVSGCGSSAGRGTAFAPPDIQSLSLAIGFSRSAHFAQNHFWILPLMTLFKIIGDTFCFLGEDRS